VRRDHRHPRADWRLCSRHSSLDRAVAQPKPLLASGGLPRCSSRRLRFTITAYRIFTHYVEFERISCISAGRSPCLTLPPCLSRVRRSRPDVADPAASLRRCAAPAQGRAQADQALGHPSGRPPVPEGLQARRQAGRRGPQELSADAAAGVPILQRNRWHADLRAAGRAYPERAARRADALRGLRKHRAGAAARRLHDGCRKGGRRSRATHPRPAPETCRPGLLRQRVADEQPSSARHRRQADRLAESRMVPQLPPLGSLCRALRHARPARQGPEPAYSRAPVRQPAAAPAAPAGRPGPWRPARRGDARPDIPGPGAAADRPLRGAATLGGRGALLAGVARRTEHRARHLHHPLGARPQQRDHRLLRLLRGPGTDGACPQHPGASRPGACRARCDVPPSRRDRPCRGARACPARPDGRALATALARVQAPGLHRRPDANPRDQRRDRARGHLSRRSRRPMRSAPQGSWAGSCAAGLGWRPQRSPAPSRLSRPGSSSRRASPRRPS
jgi:hypothetical protein